jgi:hypothetical protein
LCLSSLGTLAMTGGSTVAATGGHIAWSFGLVTTEG